MTLALRKCDCGTATIELAFVLPILTMFVLGMSDLANAIAHRYSLTRASIKASELALSQGERNGNYDYIRTEAAASAKVPIDKVIIEYWIECDYQVTSAQSCTAPALTFKYLKVATTSEFRPHFSSGLFRSSIPMTGTSVVRVQ